MTVESESEPLETKLANCSAFIEVPKADIEPALAAKAGSCVEASSKILYTYVLKEKYEDPGKLLR